MLAKVSDGPPDDVDSDLVDPVYSKIWAGYVPITESPGQPVADELAAGIPLPDYVERWRRA